MSIERNFANDDSGQYPDDASCAPDRLEDAIAAVPSHLVWWNKHVLGYQPRDIIGPELFSPNPSEKTKIALAKAVCNQCAVKNQCLEKNLDEPQGVWGGLTEDERAALRRRRGRNRRAS